MKAQKTLKQQNFAQSTENTIARTQLIWFGTKLLQTKFNYVLSSDAFYLLYLYNTNAWNLRLILDNVLTFLANSLLLLLPLSKIFIFNDMICLYWWDLCLYMCMCWLLQFRTNSVGNSAAVLVFQGPPITRILFSFSNALFACLSQTPFTALCSSPSSFFTSVLFDPGFLLLVGSNSDERLLKRCNRNLWLQPH